MSMDYKEKYEAIVGWLKKYADEGMNITPSDIRISVPELAESEDERIRKFLLDYAIEMIAGLESDISLSTYDGIKGHDPDAEAELTQWQKARGYLEKQKEQKPAEWSEEDETVLDALIRKFEGEDIYVSPHLAAEWLKSLRPQPHWKPSEEQMEGLDEAAEKYESGLQNPDYQDSGYTDNDIIDAFKAGAEWMAGQGVTCGGRIMKSSTGETYAESDYVPLDGKCGDKVIVQIRKKDSSE